MNTSSYMICVATALIGLTGCYSPPMEEETELMEQTTPDADQGSATEDRSEEDTPSAENGEDASSTGNGGDTPSTENGEDTPSTGADDDAGVILVGALPTACSRWDGHVVALVTATTRTEADVLLLALRDYTDVYAPAAAGHEQDAQELMGAYTEQGLCGWEIPTEAQARALRAEYAGDYERLNAVIGSDGDPIEVYDSSRNARWLCAEGTKTFNWAKTGSVTRAGATVRYRLRGVKLMRMRASGSRL